MAIALLLFLSLSSSLFCEKPPRLYHKTIATVKSYKEKETLPLKSGCIKRLTKNLLTPIHKRELLIEGKDSKDLLTKTSSGRLIISFLLPNKMKEEVLSLIAKKKLHLSIPCGKKDFLITKHIEVDRKAIPPKGLFAMRSSIETNSLSPSTILFIHLLRDEI
ncbi:hypothetical protein K0U07_01135 [bacterium]|nr:hypothetical protein [bacterium]